MTLSLEQWDKRFTSLALEALWSYSSTSQADAKPRAGWVLFQEPGVLHVRLS